jgi:hypothetical protein
MASDHCTLEVGACTDGKGGGREKGAPIVHSGRRSGCLHYLLVERFLTYEGSLGSTCHPGTSPAADRLCRTLVSGPQAGVLSRVVESCREREKHTPQKEKHTKRTYREIDSTPTVSEERKNSSEARDSLLVSSFSLFFRVIRSLHNFIVGLCFGRSSPARSIACHSCHTLT